MEVAIRWSHRSTPADPRFLIADVSGKTFKHCSVSSYRNGQLLWEELSRNSKVPPFRAFDWSYVHNVVAVGQWSGETTVLGLDSNSPSLPLPVKSQRQCNAVSFNTETLLATGLEKIRNDFCLHVYDINHWMGDKAARAPSFRQQSSEPVRRLASSEGITSIKFFPGQPNELVAGVKGSCVRLYDLRDSSGSPSLQYQTTCVHNIAIDPSDQNYFASASPVKDSAVHVWDKRATLRPLPGHSSNQASLDGPVLRLKDVFSGDRSTEAVSIWSLRYSLAESGCLGILGSGSNFRIFKTKKDYYEPYDDPDSPHGASKIDYAQGMSVCQTETVARASHHHRRDSRGSATESENQISAFDFINVLSSDRRPCALTLRGNQDVGIYTLRPSHPVLLTTSRQEILHTNGPKDAKGTKVGGRSNALVVEKSRKGRPVASLLAALDPQLSQILAGKQAVTTTINNLEQFNIDDGWNDAPLESSTRTLGTVQDRGDGGTLSPKFASKLRIEDLLLLSDASRRRAQEGYLYNAQKNIEIIKDSRALQDMWSWIGHAAHEAASGKMATDTIDFSYLGIFNIWNGQLGPLADHRYKIDPSRVNVTEAFRTLAVTRDVWEVEFPKTSKLEQRKLCLLACGFETNPDELLNRVKPLALSGRSIEGAFHALMGDDWQLAVTALRSGPRHQQNRALASIIALFGEKEESDRIQRQAEDLLGDDPNVLTKAIVAYISRIPIPHTVSTRLSAHHRAALAIKSFSDNELSALISERTQTAIREGDISSVVYTGLSGDSFQLFARYLEQTSDLQTTVLALTHVAPRYLRHDCIEHWRALYRAQLNSWRLFLQRAAFDLQSTRLSTAWDGTRTLAPTARQVMLRCTACDHPLHRDQPPPSGQQPAGSARLQTSSVLGSSREGTQCPRCGAGLPRCVVCDHRTGVVDPLSKGGIEAEKKAKEAGDPFAEFTELCLTCKHVYHKGHAQAWFAMHAECAAIDCRCRCNEVDGKA